MGNGGRKLRTAGRKKRLAVSLISERGKRSVSCGTQAKSVPTSLLGLAFHDRPSVGKELGYFLVVVGQELEVRQYSYFCSHTGTLASALHELVGVSVSG